ncbi:MAG: dihydroorotate dehydrogenase electron transfer subunit [Vulcanimicrobiaceae bacterium]
MTPDTATAPRVHATVVTDRREPHPGIVILNLYSPALCAEVQPGQFVMAIPSRGVLPATALGVYEAWDQHVSLMIVSAGPRTADLAALRSGDALDLLGPLGNGFFLDNVPHSVGIVAGGVGLASVLSAAKRCVAAGARATLYYGARTATALVDVDRFESAGCEVALATDDGSLGHHGFVTDLLRASALPQLLLACGPSPMMRAVAALAQERGVPAQLSLEENFGCGVGACWGCVVPLDRKSAQAPHFPPPTAHEPRPFVHARVCKEGPIFWASELKW